MRTTMLFLAALFLAVAASACGDDGGDVSTSPFGAGGDRPSDADEILDDLGAGDILDDLADGEFDESSLDDLMESAQDMAESFGGSGSGTVEINGDTIDFTSEVCFAGQGSFTIEGGGETSDGTPVWVSIDQSTESREDMEEFMSEEMLDSMFGDADTMTNASVMVEYGRSELFGSGPDDMPDFQSFSNDQLADSELTMELSDNGASGSGEATDFNFVSGDFEDRFPFTFEASCS
jgi:hypothetical protein